MSKVGQREIQTQKRVVSLFTDALEYSYLGNWKNRDGNSNIEKKLLADWLKRQGHGDNIIEKTLFKLNKAAGLGGSKTLYDANREVYGLLRYGVKIRPEVGEQNLTVWLIDWENPSNNDFAIAEEVTVAGENVKRPDLGLYVNGIALGMLELKRSTVSVAEGIRQNLDSQMLMEVIQKCEGVSRYDGRRLSLFEWKILAAMGASPSHRTGSQEAACISYN